MSILKQTRVWVPIVVAVALICGLVAGRWINRGPKMTTSVDKLNNIVSIIGSDYVDVIDTDSLIETVFPDLVSSLDPHSYYIPSTELKAFNQNMDGSFSGIGISFNMINDTVNVMDVIGGGPAERVGLLAGDRIVTVNGEEVSGKGISADEIRKRLMGEKGTHVIVGVKRNTSKKILEFDIERGDIPVNSIDAFYMIEDGIGYVHINQFGRTTYDEYINALGILAAQGAESFIIDLRGNPGGYLDMAIFMANEFLPKNSPIVMTKTRNGTDDRVTVSDGTGSFPDVPVVVLIDEYSASSSEVFSGALQDNDRALIIGRRSFGKGLIQKQTVLPDSSALQITVGRYYTPSGRSIQKDYSNKEEYENDLLRRFNNGEAFSVDSIHQDTTKVYFTAYGRKVYGGGGIMPDVFVPSDTTGFTGYYLNIVNAGLIQKYAFDYADSHREELKKAKTTDELLALLPPDDVLLRDIVNYATKAGIPARWYYINISRDLIVNQLKANIARDILGTGSVYEIVNRTDKTVREAVKRIQEGDAVVPIKVEEDHFK